MKPKRPSKVSSRPTAGPLAKAIQPFVDQGFISGAVMLAATKDKVLSLETVGYSDLATKKPMLPDSVFWIASMTKPMTCMALMILIDEGKVNVDDPVEKYLPEFKDQMVIAEKDSDHILLKKPKHPILVREVLCHTSGLNFSNAIEKPTFDRLLLSDSVRSHAMLPLLFEPGSQFNYSNAGTNTAGRIIEVVSGMPYEVFMDRHFFGPLGMKDTTFWPNEEQTGRLAKVYRTSDDKRGLKEGTFDQLSAPFYNTYRKPLPAGGLFSVAGDVVKFCQMMLNNGIFEKRRYLSKNAVRQATKKQTGPLVEKSYGFGWDVAENRYSHGGAFKTNMMVDTKLGLIYVYLIHHAGDWPNDNGHKALPALYAASEKLLSR
jgi:CubicO group peptidase (beta-lactamase class C family)